MHVRSPSEYQQKLKWASVKSACFPSSIISSAISSRYPSGFLERNNNTAPSRAKNIKMQSPVVAKWIYENIM